MSANESNVQINAKSLAEKIKQVSMNGGRPYIQQPEQALRLMAESILEAVADQNAANLTLPEIIQRIRGSSANGKSWASSAQSLMQSHNNAYSGYKQVMDERKQINAMEHATHQKNVIYRALTTLVVGLSIMSIYWLAHCLGIPMPLMRLPSP